MEQRKEWIGRLTVTEKRVDWKTDWNREKDGLEDRLKQRKGWIGRLTRTEKRVDWKTDWNREKDGLED